VNNCKLKSIFVTIKPNTLLKKFWIKGIVLDIALAVSDHVVLHLGGNPGLHGIGVSVQVC